MSKSFVENLEGRQMLAATPKLLQVTSASADNRGQIVLQLNDRAKGVSTSTVTLYSAGKDKKLYTKDDVKVGNVVVSYDDSAKRITITGSVTPNTAYRIRLNASKGMIRHASSGAALDGEFKGASTASGNGKAGGDYQFSTKANSGSTSTVVLRTAYGDIKLKLRGDVAPKTAANFLAYVNAGQYDNTFIARLAKSQDGSPFVLQGGGMRVTGDGTKARDVKTTTQFAAIPDESTLPNRLSNVVGTVSFAKSGPNTATNQFFFNMNNNSFLDSPANSGGFTPFATVDAKGLKVLQSINKRTAVDLTSQIGSQGAAANAGVDSVPVNNPSAAQDSLNPKRDLQLFSRVAVLVQIDPVA